jgi:molybdenum cofactor cytidylyltransferase
MGRPKLLMPLGDSTIIERVVAALDHPAIVARYVVTRGNDVELQKAAIKAGGLALSPPVDPPDMRSSVAFALQTIQATFSPDDDDGWLLVPADHPVLEREVIEALVEHWTTERPMILVPQCGDRRGHPTIFRWSLAEDVAGIPNDCGLNWLLKRHASNVAELAVNSASCLIDLDTPDDYARLCEMWTSSGMGEHSK